MGTLFMRDVRNEKSLCQNGKQPGSDSTQNKNHALQPIGHRGKDNDAGFTLFELVVILGTVFLLLVLAIPMLANTKPRSQRVVCASNLSQIGQAFNLWASEHGDRYPYFLPRRDGGLLVDPGQSGLEQNLWFHYWWIRNELKTPRVLACPSDPAVTVAQVFDVGPLALAVLQERSISYFMGHPLYESGRGILTGDRNITGYVAGGSCAGYYTHINGLRAENAGWSTGMHVESGNLLFNDGSVEQVDRSGLQRAVRPGLDSIEMHYIPLPRWPE